MQAVAGSQYLTWYPVADLSHALISSAWYHPVLLSLLSRRHILKVPDDIVLGESLQGPSSGIFSAQIWALDLIWLERATNWKRVCSWFRTCPKVCYPNRTVTASWWIQQTFSLCWVPGITRLTGHYLCTQWIIHHPYPIINSTFPLYKRKLPYGLLIVYKFCLSVHVGNACVD